MLRVPFVLVGLPFGTLRWQATSGDRAAQAKQNGKPSPDYFKLALPGWTAELAPEPLTSAEQQALTDLAS